jgi:multidrug transporter EmrE-like cation transporter
MDWGFFYIVSLSLIEIFGDFQLRFFAQSNNDNHLALGIVGYVGVVFFLIQSLRFNNVLYVNAMWDGVSGLVGSIAAYVLLGDRLTSIYQYLGVAFIFVGLTLLRT